MNITKWAIGGLGALALGLGTIPMASATVVTLSFTKLADLTGTSTGTTSASTAVYRADLSSLGLTSISSISIVDNSSTSAGAPGKFSGFDLDAIKLSNTYITSALNVNSIGAVPGFNFTSGVHFTPGSMTMPCDNYFGYNTCGASLFGSSGATVDNAIATLGSFDGVSSVDSTANGFISLGVGGQISFDISPAALPGGLYLYIGEVGDNGEVAAANIQVTGTPTNNVPEPGSLLLMAAGVLGLVGVSRKGLGRRKRA